MCLWIEIGSDSNTKRQQGVGLSQNKDLPALKEKKKKNCLPIKDLRLCLTEPLGRKEGPCEFELLTEYVTQETRKKIKWRTEGMFMSKKWHTWTQVYSCWVKNHSHSTQWFSLSSCPGGLCHWRPRPESNEHLQQFVCQILWYSWWMSGPAPASSYL